MVVGMLLNWPPPRFSFCNNDKWQISLGIPPSIMLLPLRSNTFNDDVWQI